MLQLLSKVGPYPYRWEIIATLIALFLPFVLTYIATTWQAATAAKRKIAGSPPTLPYMIPWLGHAISFMADGGRLLTAGVYVSPTLINTSLYN
jgi:hypothetical protein